MLEILLPTLGILFAVTAVLITTLLNTRDFYVLKLRGKIVGGAGSILKLPSPWGWISKQWRY